MLPALLNKALATVLSAASGLAWAGPDISGSYLGDAYGQVSFRTKGERVFATATGGACRFEPGTKVISGELQGHVLVASVLVCQEGGPGCQPHERHPALIIVNPHDRVLSALIRLRDGCTSPALKQNTLLLLKATESQEEARNAEAEPGSEPSVVPEAGAEADGVPAAMPASPGAAADAGSAVVMAQARRREPEVSSLEEGQRQLAAGNPVAALPHFEQVLRTDPRNPSALVGLAACHLGMGKAGRALKTLAPAAKTSSRPELHLWLAYAYFVDKNPIRARDALRRAMDLGWTPGNRPSEAVPEAALRADIDALMQQRSRKRAFSHEATGSGSKSP
jgi:Flp pilus assembly protein TadD